jgi:hypothetical protein
VTWQAEQLGGVGRLPSFGGSIDDLSTPDASSGTVRMASARLEP